MTACDRTSRGYSLESFAESRAGRDWVLDPGRSALLVHDLLPYYLSALDPDLRESVVGNCDQMVCDAMAAGVPLLASAPRPARDIAQRGLGGELWGLGPTPDEASSIAAPHLAGDHFSWIRKRSLSAFYATDLEVELKRAGRTQLLIVGVFASEGIVATSFDALARDLQVFVVSDGVADLSPHLHDSALSQVARSIGCIIPMADVHRALESG